MNLPDRACPFALGAAVFVYLTAEVMPIGAQSELAAGLGATPSQVGLLLTVYALVAAVTTLPGVCWSRRLDQRTVLVGCMILLAIAQAGFTVCESLTVAALWRGVAASAHGVLWSQVTVVAARLAGPGRAGRAASAVFLGSTLGLIVGASSTSVVATTYGWRTASGVVAVAALVCAAGLRALLPSLPPDTSTGVARGVRTTWTPVLGLCLITVVVVTGHYVSYGYLEQLALHSHLGGALLGPCVAVFGAVGVVGVCAAGRTLDHRPRETYVVVVAVTAIGLVLFVGTSQGTGLAAVALWGAGAAALPLVLNTCVLDATEEGKELASGCYVLAYQLGIGAGAALGGRVLIAAGPLGLPLVSCLFMAAALPGALLISRRDRRAIGP